MNKVCHLLRFQPNRATTLHACHVQLLSKEWTGADCQSRGGGSGKRTNLISFRGSWLPWRSCRDPQLRWKNPSTLQPGNYSRVPRREPLFRANFFQLAMIHVGDTTIVKEATLVRCDQNELLAYMHEATFDRNHSTRHWQKNTCGETWWWCYSVGVLFINRQKKLVSFDGKQDWTWYWAALAVHI